MNADVYATSSQATAAQRQLSTPSPLSVTLAPGEDRTEVNFGYVPGSISGFAYVDGNGNGLRDASESGIAAVIITRNGTATTTTAADGSYRFDAIVAGAYSITAPATAGTRTRSTPSPLNVTLAAGEDRTEVNFGYVTPPPPPCPPTTFDFSGSAPDSGTAGNVRTFTSGGQSVKAKGWSSTKAGAFSPAYLAVYSRRPGRDGCHRGRRQRQPPHGGQQRSEQLCRLHLPAVRSSWIRSTSATSSPTATSGCGLATFRTPTRPASP